MPATGNNIAAGDKTMSTRLLLSGHNFSEAGLPQEASCAEFLLDTPDTLLVPAQLFEPGMEEAYMRRSGYSLAIEQCVAVSEPVDGVIALMAFPRSAVETLNRRYGQCRFFSPLQEIMGACHGVGVMLTQQCAYIVLRDGELRFADVLSDTSVPSLVYCLHCLQKEFPASKFRVSVCGIGAEAVRKELSVYFKMIK